MTAVDDEDLHVSSAELFFDLVFVFTMTQLTTLLVAEPTATGLAKVALIFGNLWWMYRGYAWLTNSVPPRDTGLRVLLLVGMPAFLIVALAIPHAFGSAGVAFGVAYVAVTAMHTGMFLRASRKSTVRAVRRLGPYNAVTAGLVTTALLGLLVVAGLWCCTSTARTPRRSEPCVMPRRGGLRGWRSSRSAMSSWCCSVRSWCSRPA